MQRDSASDMSDGDHYLDVKGLLCPLPVLKARKRMRALKPGDILKVDATDPASVIDFPHYCGESGHELVEQGREDDVFTFRIRHK
jgi:tRNA 2-thiouridine synthesizing protein A